MNVRAQKIGHRSNRRASRRLRLESLEHRLVLAAPVAADDHFQTVHRTLLSEPAAGVLANDTDADGDALTATLVDDVAHGSLVFREDGSFDYTPDVGFVGQDTFTYRAVPASQTLTFNVNASQSNVDIAVAVSVTEPIDGSDSDSDSSRLTGTVTATVTPAQLPLDEIHVTDLNVSLADGISLDFCLATFIVCLAGVSADAAPGDLVVSMSEPGPPAPVQSNGSFLQPNNNLRVTGTVNIDATGAAEGEIPEGPTPFDTDGAIADLAGSVTANGSTLTLNVPFSFSDVFAESGATLDVTLVGEIVATAQLINEQSNLATVTIDVVPRVDATSDLVHARENQTLIVEAGSRIDRHTVITNGSIWRYLDDGSNQQTAWRNPGFDDSGWSEGRAPLGYGDGDETTVIECAPVGVACGSGSNFVTSYFRKTFQIEHPGDVTELIVGLQRDDGAVVHLNGVEVARDGLPPGAAFDTFATSAADDGDLVHLFSIDPGLLVDGENVIAVEVHQTSRTSSDVTFNLTLTTVRDFGGLLADDDDRLGSAVSQLLLIDDVPEGTLDLDSDGSFTYAPVPASTGEVPFRYVPLTAGATVLVAPGSTWKYLDDGSNQGTAWRAASFDDDAWQEGPARLGYGDPEIVTEVGFGGDDDFKHITTYFRHEFNVANPTALGDFVYLSVIRDDGMAAYLNGVRVALDSLAEDAPFDVFANDSIGGSEEDAAVQFAVPTGMLASGRNVLAVEIHQRSRTSSDIAMDLWLTDELPPQPVTVTIVVDPVNDAPVAEDDGIYEARTDDDLVVDAVDGVLSNDTDAEDDALQAVLVAPPASGSVDLSPDGSFTFTPAAEGIQTFTYRAVEAGQTTLVGLGSRWKYLDNGSDQGTAWTGLGFDTGTWSDGTAQLGYGEGDELTVVGCGPDAPDCDADNFITTYFRHEFEITDPDAVFELLGNLQRDDGAVIHVNGDEVFRSNMPGGDIGFQTLSLGNASDDGNDLHAFTIDPSKLLAGTNVIAVEVHQQSTGSSDVTFDLELFARLASEPATVTLEVIDDSLPQVAAVLVGGTLWDADVLAALDAQGLSAPQLGAAGFAIPGGADQLVGVSWSTVDRVTVVFTEPVAGLPDSLAISGAAGGARSADSLETSTGPGGEMIATWTLVGGPLEADTWSLVLDDTIASPAGTMLDGDWTDGGDTFPSGDGDAGGDFAFSFQVIPGDIDRDGDVDRADIAALLRNSFVTASTPGYNPPADVNADARINLIDTVLMRDLFAAASLAPAPARTGPAAAALAVDEVLVARATDPEPAAVPWRRSAQRTAPRTERVDRPAELGPARGGDGTSDRPAVSRLQRRARRSDPIQSLRFTGPLDFFHE